MHGGSVELTGGLCYLVLLTLSRPFRCTSGGGSDGSRGVGGFLGLGAPGLLGGGFVEGGGSRRSFPAVAAGRLRGSFCRGLGGRGRIRWGRGGGGVHSDALADELHGVALPLDVARVTTYGAGEVRL